MHSPARSRLRVSIVMPTCGRGTTLGPAVRAALDAGAFEVVVVVDGSRDGSIELLESLAHDDDRLRPVFVAHRGENAARQVGAEAARGDVLLFLDDDVVAAPGLAHGHATHHVEAASRGEHRVVVGYMPVWEPALRRQASARVYSGDYEHRCSWYEANPTRVLFELWGGNCSLRRDDCLEIGFEASGYPCHQHTDREFGIRCDRHGLIGTFDRALLAEHRYTRSSREFLDRAADQVRATMLIHELYGDVLGRWDPENCLAALPHPVRSLVGAGHDPLVAGAELGAAQILMRAARVFGAKRLEHRALVVARAVVQQRTHSALVAGPLPPGDKKGGAPSGSVPVLSRYSTRAATACHE